MSVKNHTPGELRYLKIMVNFYGGECWYKYFPIARPLDEFLKNTAWKDDPTLIRALMQKGEYHRRIQHAIEVEGVKRNATVEHVWSIEDESKPDRWGLGADVTAVHETHLN